MRLKWYGHAAFKITTEKGVKIIIDPYQSGAYGGALSYGRIEDEADIVLTSHDHDDHGYVKDIKGKFELVKDEGEREIKSVRIKAIPTFHDPSSGRERGKNLMFLIDADDVRILHVGDLGHTLDDKKLEEIGRVDVLLIPVGGYYTIDAKEATQVMESIKPKITIPMHFKTDKCGFPISEVIAFTQGKKNVKFLESDEIEITSKTLPQTPEIYVLKHAL
ncbi:MAG: MBL fold metallo-hydrolase [Desulfobacterota bacterium]|nr:MBL fold metallo-hydrolase [Thermodesulfobacteriota bacterium]MDW8001863.1 MBL fold metallo-hydrolase [Deltaproteobacteria bacterium]